MMGATRTPAQRKRKPVPKRDVVVTVTTTYKLTQAEYQEAIAHTVEEMEQYRYGRNAIPKSTKTNVEGVKN